MNQTTKNVLASLPSETLEHELERVNERIADLVDKRDLIVGVLATRTVVEPLIGEDYTD